MLPWSASLYRAAGERAGANRNALEAAVADIQYLLTVTPSAEPLFSLRHFAAVAGLSHGFLRSVVSRRMRAAYNEFVIVGRSGKRRQISMPTRDLMKTQRFIARHILEDLSAGPNSYAYAKGSSIVFCAQLHCASRCLFKFDVREFFASIDERRAYSIFQSIGYRPLLAFELARLCTWPSAMNSMSALPARTMRSAGPDYSFPRLGSLPIGAPTSPMLSNLYMKPFDLSMSVYSAEFGLVYSRYADDVFVSTNRRDFSRRDAEEVANVVRRELSALNLKENHEKRIVLPPGARKIVLGLLVDGEKPRLSPEFKKRLRMHYFFLNRFGPVHHKERRSFPSVPMLERHLRGLIAFATQVEPDYGARVAEMHNRIPWAYIA